MKLILESFMTLAQLRAFCFHPLPLVFATAPDEVETALVFVAFSDCLLDHQLSDRS